MNKAELAEQVGQQMSATGITRRQIEEALTHAFDIITEVVNLGPVKIRGFGVFKQVTRKARPGRNPQTGKAVAIPEKRVLVFKPAA